MAQINTIFRWVKRFSDENTLDTRYKLNCHRPRKTTEQQDKEIVAEVQRMPFTTTTRLNVEFRNISAQTIRRRLNENGLFHHIPARQTPLKPEHINARIQFCEENYGRDWDNIIFSDEKTFKSFNARAANLWRPANQRFNPQYVQHVRVSGRITCGLWGFITSAGPGELCEISARMNSEEYTSILEQVYLPSTRTMFENEAIRMIFMQDNTRIHTSATARSWFNAHPEIELLKWPAYSPDLNPIENVWAQMVRHWPEHHFQNRTQIIAVATELWDDLRGNDFVPKLYRSMPTRLQEVINNNGYWCSY